MGDEGSKIPFDPSKAKEAMDQLMKTPEGRKIAEQVREKLKNLDRQFAGLSEEDKKDFVDKFKEKFSESFDGIRDKLHDNLMNNENSEKVVDEQSNNAEFNPLHSVAQPDYRLFIFAFIMILILFG